MKQKLAELVIKYKFLYQMKYGPYDLLGIKIHCDGERSMFAGRVRWSPKGTTAYEMSSSVSSAIFPHVV